jgi:hypothetical protein
MCFGARIVELCGQTVQLVNVATSDWTFKCMCVYVRLASVCVRNIRSSSPFKLYSGV